MTPSELGWSRGGKQATHCWKSLAGAAADYSDLGLLSHTLGERKKKQPSTTSKRQQLVGMSKNKSTHGSSDQVVPSLKLHC